MKYQSHCYHCKKWSNRKSGFNPNQKAVICLHCRKKSNICYRTKYIAIDLKKYSVVFSK